VSKRSLAQLEANHLDGQRVVVRADLNVPIVDGVIGDPTRIEASLPTIRHLRQHGAQVVV
jgi:phosphoglycerate kinase